MNGFFRNGQHMHIRPQHVANLIARIRQAAALIQNKIYRLRVQNLAPLSKFRDITRC